MLRINFSQNAKLDQFNKAKTEDVVEKMYLLCEGSDTFVNLVRSADVNHKSQSCQTEILLNSI